MGIFDKLTTAKPPAYTASSGSPYPPATQHPTSPAQPTGQQQQQYYGGASAGGPAGVDERPLPAGWEKQWHAGYQRYFYVDTTAPSGPQSHWIHPLDQPPSQPARAPATSYAPPAFYPPAGYQQQPVVQQHQPPVVPAAGRRPGGVNPLLAGAGGLAGGMLLGSMLESHHLHHEYDNSYADGYQQGYDNGFDNGFDTGDGWDGGADFGGGDFF